MFQCRPYSRFFLWRTLRLSGVFRFWQVIICPLNNATFLLYLCNIQVADFQSTLLQNVILNFRISGFALGSRQIKLVHLKLYLDMFICMEFGKQHDTFHMYRISKLSTVQFCVSFHSLYNTVKSRLFQQFSFYCFLHLTVIYFCRWQNGDIATNIQKLATPSRKRWGY